MEYPDLIIIEIENGKSMRLMENLIMIPSDQLVMLLEMIKINS